MCFISTLIVTASLISQTPNDLHSNVHPHLRVLKDNLAYLDDLHSVSCEYTESIEPSAYFIDLLSRADSTTPDKAKALLKAEQNITYNETKDGRFSCEINRTSEGKLHTSRMLSYDKIQNWQIAYSQEKSVQILPVVTINKPLVERYNGELLHRRCSGITVLPQPLGKVPGAWNLMRLIKENGVLMHERDELINGSETCVISWLNQNGPLRIRETVYINRNEVPVMRKYQQYYISDDNSGTVVELEAWEANKFKSIAFSGRSGRVQHWYAESILQSTWDKKHNLQWTSSLTVKTLRLNPELSGRLFTPVIEDGTLVVNGETNTTTRYGKGPSDRVKRLVAKSIADSKKELARQNNSQAETTELQPPWSWASIISTLTIVMGICGLTAGGIVATMRRKL